MDSAHNPTNQEEDWDARIEIHTKNATKTQFHLHRDTGLWQALFVFKRSRKSDITITNSATIPKNKAIAVYMIKENKKQ